MLTLPVFLIVTELPLFKGYFARNWPLLSPSHGFVTLAIAMIVIGIQVMGNLNKSAGSQQALGLAFWRIVIASGILIFTLGWINLLASYIFRDRKEGITARMVRSHGAVAIHNKTPKSVYSTDSCASHTPPAPVLAQSYIPNPIAPSPTDTNTNTSTRTSANPFRFRHSERRESGGLPSYRTAAASPSVSHHAGHHDAPLSPTSKYSRATMCTKKKVYGMFGRQSRQSLAPPLPVNVEHREMEISAPMGVNPQFAHLVQRPDSAMHPARSNGDYEAFRWRV
jgi:hypothetical protein